ncbi:MAG: hypothetical protein LBO79_07420, partial [Zoogloeaceae bacterium]|nr:hypothetical protein [Zoogloeaceae bacterium]
MNSVTEAFLNRKKGSSKSARVRAQLEYPVIDTDVHTNEFSPLLEDYVHKYGGAQSVDEFRAFRKEGSALFA